MIDGKINDIRWIFNYFRGEFILFIIFLNDFIGYFFGLGLLVFVVSLVIILFIEENFGLIDL